MTLKEAVVQTVTHQQLTKEDKKFLDNIAVLGTWTQNPETGLIDAGFGINLAMENLTKIPYKFGTVIGNFWCDHNQLTSLEGCPIEVDGSFLCENNLLTSLKYCPKVVNGYFYCNGNQLQSSKYLPPMIDNYDYCIRVINRQKTKYLTDMGFDLDDKEYFQKLMHELEK